MTNIVKMLDDDPKQGKCDCCGQVKQLHKISVNNDVTGWACMSCILQ